MKLTGKTGIILAFILSLLVIAGLWFMYTKPQVDTYRAIVTERDENLEKAAYYRDKIDEISTTGTDYLGNLFRKVQMVDALLPSNVDRGDVALMYPSRARSMGLTVIRFDPGEGGKGYHSFETEFRGSYSSILAWLDHLENAPNLITVSALSVTEARSEDTVGAFNVTMTLRFHTADQPELRPRTATGTETAPGGSEPNGSETTGGLGDPGLNGSQTEEPAVP